ncbi:MAG TPA: hypothetical protein VJ625_04305 [Propionibacteriaceae bacterium]|nr:hypothetical protein [Propionibacteriaceae bacterium]
MTVQVHGRRQDAYHKPAGVALDALLFPKGHQLTFHMRGQRPGELDGVALATTEETFGAERRRGDMEDPNVVSLLAASVTLAAGVVSQWLLGERVECRPAPTSPAATVLPMTCEFTSPVVGMYRIGIAVAPQVAPYAKGSECCQSPC